MRLLMRYMGIPDMVNITVPIPSKSSCPLPCILHQNDLGDRPHRPVTHGYTRDVSRLSGIVLIVFAAITLLALLSLNVEAVQIDDDMVVTDELVFKDERVVQNANVSIRSGGSYVFEGCDLTINGSIWIDSGGSFIVKETRVLTLEGPNIKITQGIRIQANSSSIFLLDGSSIEHNGFGDYWASSTCPTIACYDCTFRMTGCTMGFSGISIYFIDMEGVILSNSSIGCQFAPKFTRNSNVTISNVSFISPNKRLWMEWSIGPMFSYSSNISIVNCSFEAFYDYHLFFKDCTNVSISGASIRGNQTIDDNWGVLLYQCSDVVLSDSQISKATTDGVFVLSCNGVEILGCEIVESKAGIRVNGSSEVLVSRNIISSNGLGVALEVTEGTIVCLNDFFLNVVDGSVSGGIQNTWDRDGRGNYWDHYNGSDYDGDHIGDVPYDVAWNARDNYPLVHPRNVPGLKLLYSLPADMGVEVPVDEPILLAFNLQLRTGTLVDAVSIEPATSLKLLSVSGREHRWVAMIAPVGGLKDSTRYTLTVSTGLRDILGRPLDTDYYIHFTTEDSTAPDIHLVSPANNSWITPWTPLRISVIDPFLEIVTLTDGIRSISSTEAVVDFSTDRWADGPARLHVEATDRSGNMATADFMFNVDGTIPFITKLEPGNNSFLRGDRIISVMVTDANPTVLVVSCVEGEWESTNGSLEIDPRGWNEGVIVLHLTATDRLGNRLQKGLLYALDRTPPTVTLENPEPFSVLSEGDIIYLTIDDEFATVSKHSIAGGEWFPDVLPPENTVQLVAEGLPDGPFPVRLDVTDLASNTLQVAFWFIMDSTSPAISFRPDMSDRPLGASATIEVSIEEANLAWSMLVLDGETLQEGQFHSFLVGLTTLLDGPHTISVHARDAAGNAVGGSYSFTLDATPPRIKVILPTTAPYISNHDGIRIEIEEDSSVLTEVFLDLGRLAAYGTTPIALDTSEWAHGLHSLDVTAQDLAGNSANLTIMLFVDSRGPSIRALDFRDGGAVSPGGTLTLDVADDTEVKVTYRFDDDPYVTVGRPWTLQIPNRLKVGPHMLSVRGVDLVGNEGTLDLTVDVRSPNITGGRNVAMIGIVILIVSITALVISRQRFRKHRLKGKEPPREGPLLPIALVLMVFFAISVLLSEASFAISDNGTLANTDFFRDPTRVSDGHNVELWSDVSYAEVGFPVNHINPCSIGDLNEDGFMDFITIIERTPNYQTEYSLEAFDGRSGVILWSMAIDMENQFDPVPQPTVVDYDADGDLEVFFSEQDGYLKILNGGTGALEGSTFIGGIDTTSKFADIDSDGVLDIIVGSRSYYPNPTVTCLSGRTLEPIWTYMGNFSVALSPAIGDIDGDGGLEVVIKAYAGGWGSAPEDHPYMFKSGRQVVVLDASDGHEMWCITLPGSSYFPPIIADIDEDGTNEVVQSYDTDSRAWIVLNGLDGRTEAFLGKESYYTWSYYFVLDINGDQKMDVINKLGDPPFPGSSYFPWPINFTTHTKFLDGRLVMVYDLDGDGLSEVLVQDGALRLLKANEPRVGVAIDGLDRGSVAYPQNRVYQVNTSIEFPGRDGVLEDCWIAVGDIDRSVTFHFSGDALVSQDDHGLGAVVELRGHSVESDTFSPSRYLHLDLVFGWSYPIDGPSHIYVRTRHNGGFITDFGPCMEFTVERGLDIVGDPVVSDEQGQALSGGWWAPDGAEVIISNLTVVHRGSAGLEAPPVFGVVASSDGLLLWRVGRGESGPRLWIAFTLPRIGPGVHRVSLAIALDDLVPGATSTARRMVVVMVDAEGPTVGRCVPPPGSWVNRTTVICTMTVDDGAGSGVDPGSILWGLSGPGSSEGPLNVPTTIVRASDGFEGSADVHLPEDGQYVLTWTVCDAVGNALGPLEVILLRDMRPPTITVPGAREWYNSTTVELEATVSDALSGIDPSSLTLLLVPEGTASQPMPILDAGEDGSVRALIGGLAPGLHWALWSARDRAGNQATLAHRLGVDVDPPTLSPRVPALLNTTDGRVSIEVTCSDGDGSGFGGCRLEWNLPMVPGGWESFGPLEAGTEVVVLVRLTLSADTGIALRIRDRAGNLALIDRVWLDLNERPTAIVSSPTDGSTHRPGDPLLLDGSRSLDPEGEDLVFRWTVDGVSLDHGGARLEVNPSAGSHTVRLEVSDGFNVVSSEVVAFAVSKDLRTGSGSSLVVLLAIAIALAVGAGFVLWRPRKRG